MTTAAKKTAAQKKATASSTPAKTADTTTTEAPAPEETPAETATTEAPAEPVADPAAADQETADAEAGDGSQDEPQPTNSGLVQNFGPGTSNPGVPDETSVRPPATVVNSDPKAAPLTPPADSHTQRAPELGHPKSSTSQTYAESGGRTIAGENHYRLTDRGGNTLGPDDLFEDAVPAQPFLIAKQEVLEEFTYPNTHTPVHRRVFGKGTHVPRFQADRIKAAAKADAEMAAAQNSGE